MSGAAVFCSSLLLRAPGLQAKVSPDAGVLVATVGLCLIALELNRPGRILPGSLGLLLVLLAGATLAGYPLQMAAVAGLFGALGVLLLNLWFRVPVPLLALATLALVVALRWMVSPTASVRVGWLVAAGCGSVLGAGGAMLSRVAFRARRAKRVN